MPVITTSIERSVGCQDARVNRAGIHLRDSGCSFRHLDPTEHEKVGLVANAALTAIWPQGARTSVISRTFPFRRVDWFGTLQPLQHATALYRRVNLFGT